MSYITSSATSSIDYLTAWHAWADHQDISMRTLWHIEIFWWGRIGKALELAGGATVIATIIGPTRLNAIAKKLRNNSARRLAAERRSKVPVLWRRYLKTIKGTNVQLIANGISLLGLLFFTVLGILNYGISSKVLFSGYISEMASVTSVIVTLAFVLPALVLVPVLAVVVSGYALDYIVARPLAAGVKTATRESVVQGAGLLLLAIGIQFDLLSV